jgi:hypothetical protein
MHKRLRDEFGDYFYVHAELDGVPALLIADTGCPNDVMLTEEFAAEHFGYRPKPGRQDDPMAQIKRLTKGPDYLVYGGHRIPLQDREVDIHKMSAGWSGTDIDGWVGMHVLCRFYCVFDFRTWELQLLKGLSGAPDLATAAREGAALVPLVHDPEPFVRGHLEGLPGRWLVDIGRSNTAVYLDSYLRAGLEPKELEDPDPDYWVAGWDCRGFHHDSLEIAIGPVDIELDWAAVTDYKPGRDYNETAIELWLGDLGTEALSLFPVVVMTRGARALWLIEGEGRVP